MGLWIIYVTLHCHQEKHCVTKKQHHQQSRMVSFSESCEVKSVVLDKSTKAHAKAYKVILTKSLLMNFCKQQLMKKAGLYFQLCKGIKCYNLCKIRFILHIKALFFTSEINLNISCYLFIILLFI